MGSYINSYKVYSNGTEIAFWKEVIQYITGLDTRITCANDPDVEFDISTKGSDYVPEFNFKVNNIDFFKIKRNANLSSSTYNATISMVLSNSTSVSENSLSFFNENRTYSQEGYRGYQIGSVISQNVLIIYIQTDIAPSSKYFRSIITISGTSLYKSGIKNKNKIFVDLDNDLFYDCNFSTGNVGKFLSRFNYATLPGTIDYVKSAVFYDYNAGGSNDNRVKAFEIPGIYDCTTVIAGDTVSLKDGIYVAVSPHELIKIS